MVRFKNRYITAEVVPAKLRKNLELKHYDVYSAITEAVKNLHGEFGLASLTSGLRTKYSNCESRVLILRARHGPHLLLTSALPFVKRIGDQEVNLRIIHVGASLMQCYHRLTSHHIKFLAKNWPHYSKRKDFDDVKHSLMDVEEITNLEKPSKKVEKETQYVDSD